MPPRKYVLLQRNLMGDLIDLDGNRCNEDGERIDYLGRVIPEPEEEPITSSLGNGSAGAWQPQTLADFNDPYRFYHKRAEIQAEIDRFNEEPPEHDFQFQSRGPSYGWDDAPLQVQEAPVQQLSVYEMFQQLLESQRRCYDSVNEKLDEVSRDIAERKNQEEVVHEKFEEKAEFDVFGSVSIDTVECVDRHMPKLPESDENLAKSKGEESSELVSIDTDLCVDRHKAFPSQVSSEGVSIDTVLCVDRHDPSQHQTDVLESADTTEPLPKPPYQPLEPPEPDPEPLHDPTPPEPLPYPESPEPDPKPPEHYEIEVDEVLPKDAATPGSCHKRKLPDTTLQPPLKRIRAYQGVAIIPIAADLIDPGDTFAVYSRGPRPPPPKHWYVLFELPSSSAGTHSYPPSAHPDAAYLPDPETTDAVYHMGPRPP